MPWDSPYRLPTRETETRGTTQEISLRQVVHFKPTATGHFEVAGVIGVAAATEDMTVLQTLEACLSSLKGGEAATGCVADDAEELRGCPYCRRDCRG
ncbi:hypothetical protein GN244_ATG19518 [Phytophthora infestans]|uniref:Uncharacterized protein n=1 Tax=Phytophthora infestans TaxID=4787 RepID=A0A833VU59_PHYIN|nr:hypothetical protein GN244_ATG19518 [Phytophthora infestans]